MAEKKDNAYYQQLTDSINTNSKANFVQRLNADKLKSIPDWEDNSRTATHKMSYAEQDGKYYVYPSVQEIDGELHDFTDPRYKHGKWDAFKSAMDRGDYVEFPDEESAAWWSSNGYKQFYPHWKKKRTIFDVARGDE